MSIARYLSKFAKLLGSDGKVPAAGIADGAITAAKLSSGNVLKVQNFYNVGSSTSSSSYTGLQSSRFSYTPVSTNSRLLLIHSAYTYMNPAGGFPAGGCYGFWKIAEYNGTTDVGASDAAFLWSYDYSNTYMESVGAQSTLQWYSPNTSLTPRLFTTIGAVNYAGSTTLSVGTIYLTVIEVAN